MLITDHISTMVPNPLLGANLGELGPRFPDMSEVYSRRMGTIVKAEAEKLGISLKEGVYLQLTVHPTRRLPRSACSEIWARTPSA